MSVLQPLRCIRSSTTLFTRNSMHVARLAVPIGSHSQRNNRCQRPTDAGVRLLERHFIHSLVVAGTCSTHRPRRHEWRLRAFLGSSKNAGRRRLKSHNVSGGRCFGSMAGQRAAPEAASQTALLGVSTEDMRGLVDEYLLPSEERAPMLLGAPPEKAYRNISPRSAADTSHSTDNARLNDTRSELVKLVRAQGHPDVDKIHALYQQLPYPRMVHLSDGVSHKLLHRLSVVEHKSEAAMLRYLSAIDDAKTSGLALDVSEWSSAVAFVGRCFTKVTASQVEHAILLWKEMENEAGVKGNHATFTTLFDIATKAGKYVLAEAIMKEMQARGLQPNRYFRTGLIYHYGLRMDSHGVRTAYRELVDAGEVVDITVINCVIAALLNCGEPSAADRVLERVKSLHAANAHGPPPPSSWQGQRDLARALERATQRLKSHPHGRQEMQAQATLAPDLRTYKILLYHHAVTAGDMDRTSSLLDELDYYGITLHGSIFLYLFKAFAVHGGIPYSSWTRSRLERTWAALVKALDAPSNAVYMSKSLARLALSAFAKCADRERVWEVWDQTQQRWHAGKADWDAVEGYLQKLF